MLQNRIKKVVELEETIGTMKDDQQRFENMVIKPGN